MSDAHTTDQIAKTPRVTGIGGVFFKARDPVRLMAWYAKHLDVKPESSGSSSSIFQWRDKVDPNSVGYTVWAIFPRDTEYFDPSASPFMINFRVKDLDALLKQLKREEVTVDEKTKEYDYGKFAWIIDPEGNRIELWEPKGEPPS